ncbi:50S ribosomal protein L17 [Patescibacteria group bacterium]|nr:50S ribosomal protein L17 [Patescibacteria group bacterium]
MRHKKSKGILDRKKAPRKALMRSLAESLVVQEKITTTHAKAKNLRSYVEKLITLSKDENVLNRRTVIKSLYTERAIKKLFVLGKRFKDRPGGYTRITKIGNRKGDNASMVKIELVSQNEKQK